MGSPRRFWLGLGGLLAATVAVGAVVIAGYGWLARPQPADCVVILGCGLKGAAPTPLLVARLEHGLDLYRRGYARTVIVSGGQGAGEAIPEAVAMKRYLLARGLPARDVLVEDRSSSTLTNLRYTQELMRQQGLVRAVIVSSWFHLARAALIARHLGLSASLSGAANWRYWPAEIAGWLREIPAIGWAVLTW